MPGVNTWVNPGMRNAAFRRGMSQTQSDIRKLSSQVGGSLGRSNGVTGLAASLTVVSKELTEVANVAERLGFSTKFIQEFNFGLRETGLAMSTGQQALQRFVRRTAEAREGTGEAVGALEELGIEFANADGRYKSNEQLLREVADALDATGDEATRTRLAFKLFDSEGVKLLTTLQGGFGCAGRLCGARGRRRSGGE